VYLLAKALQDLLAKFPSELAGGVACFAAPPLPGPAVNTLIQAGAALCCCVCVVAVVDLFSCFLFCYGFLFSSLPK